MPDNSATPGSGPAGSTVLDFPAVLRWDGRILWLLDQTRLPVDETYLEVASVAALRRAVPAPAAWLFAYEALDPIVPPASPW